MVKLSTLRRRALRSTDARGHRMHWFAADVWQQLGACLNCSREVLLRMKPAPNEIAIGGEALALDCTGTHPKHKAGPWILNGRAIYTDGQLPGAMNICTLHGRGELMQANGRLIAMAPELLAFAWFVTRHGGACKELRDAAAAYIAKAEGRSDG